MSNLNWFFAQTRKYLPLGFLIDVRIINDFRWPTNLTFIIIKIGFLNKYALIIHENFQNFAGFR